MIQLKNMEARSKIWIEIDGNYFMGDGRARLLEKIDNLGSISKAAKELGISYRHAWGQIKKIEGRVGRKIVQGQRGGQGGGGSELTKEGRAFLEKYKKFRSGINEMIDKKMCKVFKVKTDT